MYDEALGAGIKDDKADTFTAQLFSKFVVAVASLKEQIDKWHEWLLSVYVYEFGYMHNNKRHIKNPTGMKLCVTDLPKGKDLWQRKAKIAAFVLQGQEAAFIHHLTVLSSQYDYVVLQNEHDGLVTIGKIPNAAVDEAAALSGLKYAELENKPFFL